MTDNAGKRIALLGFELESNRFAPVIGQSEFAGKLLLKGVDITSDLATKNPHAPGTLVGFARAMDKTGPWTPVPLMVASAGAAGAVEHAYYLEVKDKILRRLKAELPVDGVYFCEHGAAVTTEISDPDGDLFSAVRALVGPDEHPTVANMAVKMSTPRNRDLFKGVQFIGFSTLESGMV